MGNSEKGSIWIKMDGIFLSKGMAPQSNHRCGYWPRDFVVGNQIAGRGFRIPGGLEDEIEEMENCMKKTIWGSVPKK